MTAYNSITTAYLSSIYLVYLLIGFVVNWHIIIGIIECRNHHLIVISVWEGVAGNCVQ